MSEEFDTRNTDEPICPHCGKEFVDAWEMFADGARQVETACWECGQEVIISEQVTTTYSTEKGGKV